MNDIEIFPKTELQEDWYSHSAVNISSSAGTLAINLDGSGRLVVSYINGTSVFSAYRNLDTDGNSDRTWTVEDTHLGLPSSVTPKFLDSILSPSKATFLALIGSDDNIYILDCSSRFSRWELRENKQGITPVKLNLFITRKNELRIAVFTSTGKIFILNPAPFTNIWFEDKAIAFNVVPVYHYQVGAAFTETGNLDNSTWGYVVCGGVWGSNMEAGVGVLAADQTLPTLETIYKGKYSSLTYAVRGGHMSRTTPLVFGIDESKKATYFKANGDGKYSATFPFGSDLNFTSLDSIWRTGPNQSGDMVEWIDLYGLDISGNLWHTRSGAIHGSRFAAVRTLSDGTIVVPEWETGSIISFSTVKSFDVARETSGTGHAYVVAELSSTSSTSNSLVAYVQDISSTSWTADPVAKFDHTVPQISKRNVYYVELTVRQGGTFPRGLTVKITAPEYCPVDVDGVSTSVTAGQFYITKTNARGLICLTIPASESLACPVVSIWVQGMAEGLLIDIQPTGQIQKRFASLTVDDLKEAKDKTDQSLIFKNLTDDQLKNLSAELQKAVRPFTNSVALRNKHARRYLHPKASQDVSMTRHASDPHMGLISHANQKVGASFQIRLNSTQQSSSMEDNPPTTTKSWGDFWAEVAKGAVKILTMTLETAAKAVKATITYLADNVKTVWNGVASFVHEVFDVIAQLFRDVKVETAKIFNWLAYIFAWEDIKATAVAFRTIVDEQIGKAEDFLDKTAKARLKSFFGEAKDWIKDNMETAITESDKIKVGDNDKPKSDPQISLPSSASWLSSKVESESRSNNPKLDPALTIPITDKFNTTIKAFRENLKKTGISEDLAVALQKASDLFSNLTSRDGLDQLTFKAFADIFKSLGVLLIDLTQAVIFTLIDVLVEVLKMFKTFLDTPIEIPLVSKIFKEVVKLDLTLFNLIAVPMAIPATVLYKTFMGVAPFPVVTSTTGSKAASTIGSKADPKPKKTDKDMVWALIFTIIYGTTDSALDFYGLVSEAVDRNRQFDPVMKFLTYTSMMSSWVVMGLGVYSKPTTARTKFAWEATVIGTVCSTTAVVFFSANRIFGLATRDSIVAEDKIIDAFGTLIPTVYGITSFTSGIWHIVNIFHKTEPGDPKDMCVVAAELGGALPGMAKIVKFSNSPMTWAPPLAIVDAVGYLTATVAYSIAMDM